jgi:hypothetical protein
MYQSLCDTVHDRICSSYLAWNSISGAVQFVTFVGRLSLHLPALVVLSYHTTLSLQISHIHAAPSDSRLLDLH